MKTRLVRFTVVVAVVLAIGALAGACGRSGQAGHHSHQGMAMDMSASNGPSRPAAMICSAETRDAVRRTFGLSSPPTSAHTWNERQRLYSCVYDVRGGRLTLSVKDAADVTAGRGYFGRLRSRLTGVQAIRGVQALGFPSYQSTTGQVVFLKDGKTLDVDAGRLPGSALPKGFSRAEAAYGVASAVIACWTE